MLDKSSSRSLRFALRVESFTGAIPLRALKRNAAQILAPPSLLTWLHFILNLVYMGSISCCLVFLIVKEVYLKVAVSPSTVILRIFTVSTTLFITATQLNLLLHEKDLRALINGYFRHHFLDFNRALEPQSETTSNERPLLQNFGTRLKTLAGVAVLTTGMYINMFLPNQLTLPLLFTALYLQIPEDYPSMYLVLQRLVSEENQGLLVFVWALGECYQWLIILGVIQFYLFSAIIFTKGIIYQLQGLKSRIAKLNLQTDARVNYENMVQNYRRLELLAICYNQATKTIFWPAWLIIFLVAHSLSLCGLVKYHGEVALVHTLVYISCIGVLTLTEVVLYTWTGQVYSLSKRVLLAMKSVLSETRMSNANLDTKTWVRLNVMRWKSCKVIGISVGAFHVMKPHTFLFFILAMSNVCINILLVLN